jgi:hypothetical protein
MTRLLRSLLVAGVLAGTSFALAPPANAVCWYVDGNNQLVVKVDCNDPGPGTGYGPSGFIVVEGTATLPTFPCAPNCAGGHFQSSFAAGATTAGGLVTGLSADFTYAESCIAVPLLGVQALQGTAKGTLHVSTSAGNVDVGFSWARVGLVAVLSGNGGNALVGAAVFVPSVLPPCDSSSPVNATVAGGGLLV